jgi:hypothetical protein
MRNSFPTGRTHQAPTRLACCPVGPVRIWTGAFSCFPAVPVCGSPENEAGALVFGTVFCGRRLRLFAALIVALLVSMCMATAVQAAERRLTIYMDGTTTATGFAPDGSVTIRQDPKPFTLRLSGCAWAVRLYANTNLPNGITDVTCDGTNIYVLVPDAGGNIGGGRSRTSFAQSGAVFPGVIKGFPDRMAAIWWAYCSVCVISDDGAVLDFMELTGTGATQMLYVKLRESVKAQNRIGAIEASLFPLKSVTGQTPRPMAHYKPLESKEIDGLNVVTLCSVTIYSAGGDPDEKPYARYEYLVAAQDVRIEHNSVSFVPEIASAALISDYRMPHSGEYLADRWLDADERRKVQRSPLAATPSSASPPEWKRRGVLFALIILALVGLGLTRLLWVRKEKHTT